MRLQIALLLLAAVAASGFPAESTPEQEPEPEPEHMAEPEPEPQYMAEPEPEAESKPEHMAEPEPEHVVEPKPEAESKPEHMAEPEPEHMAEPEPHTRNILEVITSMNTTSMFLLEIVNRIEVMTLLKSPGTYTVFVPTDEAFLNMDESLYTKATSDQEYMDRVIKKHIIPMELMSENFVGGVVPTISGEDVSLYVLQDGAVVVNDIAMVSKSDVMASNGVIHVIDNVLLPVARMGEFDPSNAAVSKHNGTTIMALEQMSFTNEQIALLVGPDPLGMDADQLKMMLDSPSAENDIMAALAEKAKNIGNMTGSGSFIYGRIMGVADSMGMDNFLGLSYKAGLMSMLIGRGPKTVFIPSEAAFDKVDPKVIMRAMSDNQYLQELITIHIVNDEIMSENIPNDGAYAMSGEHISIDVRDGTMVINGVAMVTKADVMASNGVIHIIDSVLVPTPRA